MMWAIDCIRKCELLTKKEDVRNGQQLLEIFEDMEEVREITHLTTPFQYMHIGKVAMLRCTTLYAEWRPLRVPALGIEGAVIKSGALVKPIHPSRKVEDGHPSVRFEDVFEQ